MNILPVVLSGGAGTRLWPLSREHHPKQLIGLLGEDSLLQETIARLDGLQDIELTGDSDVRLGAPLVVCNEEHRFMVAEQMRRHGRAAGSVLLEPAGRNTAPALTLAALHAAADGDDPVLLVMPADHVIQEPAAFHAAVAKGAALAKVGSLVTFGIVPTRAETGYGYIRMGEALDEAENGYRVDAFVEKPNAATAHAYLDSGRYLWNSGMFMMKASVWLEAIAAHRPDIAAACRSAYANGRSDEDFFRADKALFESCPSESIDYAVMERLGDDDSAHTAAVVPLDAGWSDVGSWLALWEVSGKDEAGNVSRGEVFLEGTQDTLLFAQHRIVAGVGLRDLIVVETADAVLVAHKDATQDVKNIVTRLKAANRSESLTHRCVQRPWGSYEGVDRGERFQVKRIVVAPGASLSLQMHHHRAEHWIVVHGTARVTRGEETFLLAENQSTYIPIGVVHRLENPGTIPLELIEVQSGSYLGEDDIVRFDDQYGRSSNKTTAV